MQETKYSQEVRRLKSENRKLKAKIPQKQCNRCANQYCDKGSRCPAMGQRYSKCNKLNHYAKACHAESYHKTRFSKENQSVHRLSSAEESDSDESSSRIVVGKLTKEGITVKVKIGGRKFPGEPRMANLATDTGVTKTILNRADWNRIKQSSKFVKTSKRFRPFGTTYRLPIRGKAKITMIPKKVLK